MSSAVAGLCDANVFAGFGECVREIVLEVETSEGPVGLCLECSMELSRQRMVGVCDA